MSVSRPYGSRQGSYEQSRPPPNTTYPSPSEPTTSPGSVYSPSMPSAAPPERQSSYGGGYSNGNLATPAQQAGYVPGHRPTASAGNYPQQRTSSPASGHRSSASASQAVTGSSPMHTPPPPQEQQQQQQMGRPNSGRPSAGSMHDMARVVALFSARKFYCEGYIKKQVDLGGDGRPPNQGDPLAHWDDWFAQLTGSELSLWNVAAMTKAAAAGTTVPPTYLKISDSFVTFVDLNPRKASGGGPPPDAPWVFALNNAGSNRILFAAADEMQHRRWLNALRLAEWEVSRLSEIYTATLLGLRGPSFCNRTPLLKGRMEGMIDVRLPGETEWSKAFLVLSDAATREKAKRRSSILSLSFASSRDLASQAEVLPDSSYAALFASKKSKKPFLVISQLLTIYAVYPESEHLIHTATIAKVEGTAEWDPEADLPKGFDLHARRRDVRDGGRAGNQTAMLFMPDDIARDGHARMLEWILGFCDVFKHFGRGRTAGVRSPHEFDFDPRKSASPYYAYPIGPARDQLFFAPAAVEHLDIYERRPEQIKASFQDMLVQRMRRAPSTGPQHPAGYLEGGATGQQPARPGTTSPRPPHTSQAPGLAPIGESSISSRNNSVDGLTHAANVNGGPPAAMATPPKPALSIDTNPAGGQHHQQQQQHQPPAVVQRNLMPGTLNESRSSYESSRDSKVVTPPATSGSSHTLGAAALGAGAIGGAAAAAAAYDRRSNDGTETVKDRAEPSTSAAKALPGTPSSSVSMAETSPSLGPSQWPSAVTPADALPVAPAAAAAAALTSAPAPKSSMATTSSLDVAPANEASYDSSTHGDLMAALNFIQREPSPPQQHEIVAPTPRKFDHASRRPPSAGSSSQATGAAGGGDHSGPSSNQHQTHVVEPSSPDEYSAPDSGPSKAPIIAAAAVPAAAVAASGFAKSRQAEEREAAAKSHVDNLHRPGRSGANLVNGKQPATTKRRPVGDFSSDEDEEEDEEEDSDGEAASPLAPPLSQAVTSPVLPAAAAATGSPNMAGSGGDHQRRASRRLPTPPSMRALDASGGRASPYLDQSQQQPSQSYGHQPRGSWQSGVSGLDRSTGSPYGSRPESYYGNYPAEGDYQQQQQPQQRRAINPGGLLQAGLQNKQDRSAKAMEANAKDTGGPLIDLPAKAPVAQGGLISAIDKRAEERRRDGGLGATITREERENREAQQRAMMQQQQMGGGNYHPGFMGSPGGSPMMPQGGFPMMPMMPGMPGMPGMPMNDPNAMAAFFQWQQIWMQQMWAFSQQQAAAGMQAPMSPSMMGNPYGGMSSPQLGQGESGGASTPGAGMYAGYAGAPGAYPTTPYGAGYAGSNVGSPFGAGPTSSVGGQHQQPPPNFLGNLPGVGSGLGDSGRSSRGDGDDRR